MLVVDANGMPNKTYPQYTPTSEVVDGQLTVQCADPTEVASRSPSANDASQT